MSQMAGAPLHIAGAWDVYPANGWKRQLWRAVKQLLFCCYLYCGWIPVRDRVQSRMGSSRIVILNYHRVGWMDLISKSTSDFRAELQYLARHYECLTVRQLVQRLESTEPIRRKIAVITFDDGYRDNYLSAFPELRRMGIPATFFVATGYIGTNRCFPHDTRAMQHGYAARDDWEKLSWSELRQMQEAGMEIGSHTVEHTNMGSADAATIRRELCQSLEMLRRELGDVPRCFAFPWGTVDDISRTAVEELRKAGYYAALTTLPGTVRRGDDLLLLRRIDVGNGQFTRLGMRARVEGLGFGWLMRHREAR